MPGASLASVDAASAVAFRIGFGLIMACWCFDELRTGRVHELFIAPQFHFPYALFDFVRPWPGHGMVLQFLAMLLLALCVAAGLCYRVATFLFALGFTHVFLIDQTNYQNHYYLLMLISWMMVLLPLNRCASLDVLLGYVTRSEWVPVWCLWLLRFHIALPYVFGGLAKIHSDWLAGEPMRSHLLAVQSDPAWRSWLASEPVVAIFSWGGLLFDLAIVPLLLWRPSRGIAYVMCVVFHLMNARLFDIHVFPWFMIVATTVFFEPDWPRRFMHARHFTDCEQSVRRQSSVSWSSLSWQRRTGGVLLVGYCCVHLLLPFRHLAYSGDAMWTGQGHLFAWRMMLRVKDSALRMYVTDTESGVTGVADLRRFVTLEQYTKASREPELILQLAHHVAREFRRTTGRTAEVRALVLTSLNGRKPQLLIDPNCNLAAEPTGWHARRWIMPLTEPLRREPWAVPMNEWERVVELPPLMFLAAGERQAALTP